MKNAPPPDEILYVTGGLTTAASFSVDPDPKAAEEDRQEARRKARRASEKRRRKRRALDKAAKGSAS